MLWDVMCMVDFRCSGNLSDNLSSLGEKQIPFNPEAVFVDLNLPSLIDRLMPQVRRTELHWATWPWLAYMAGCAAAAVNPLRLLFIAAIRLARETDVSDPIRPGKLLQ